MRDINDIINERYKRSSFSCLKHRNQDRLPFAVMGEGEGRQEIARGLHAFFRLLTSLLSLPTLRLYHLNLGRILPPVLRLRLPSLS